MPKEKYILHIESSNHEYLRRLKFFLRIAAPPDLQVWEGEK